MKGTSEVVAPAYGDQKDRGGRSQTEAPERPQSLISSLLRVTGDRERGRRGPEPARGAQEARGGRGSEGSSGEVPESAGIGFLIVFLWFSFQNQYGNQKSNEKPKGTTQNITKPFGKPIKTDENYPKPL